MNGCGQMGRPLLHIRTFAAVNAVTQHLIVCAGACSLAEEAAPSQPQCPAGRGLPSICYPSAYDGCPSFRPGVESFVPYTPHINDKMSASPNYHLTDRQHLHLHLHPSNQPAINGHSATCTRPIPRTADMTRKSAAKHSPSNTAMNTTDSVRFSELFGIGNGKCCPFVPTCTDAIPTGRDHPCAFSNKNGACVRSREKIRSGKCS